ncbi:unnamed protein product [Linum trigynum]
MNNELVKSEDLSLQRSKLYDRAVTGICRFVEGEKVLYVYQGFDCDLEEYVKTLLSNGQSLANEDCLRVVRHTLRALHELHQEHEVSHGNLTWKRADPSGPLNVVVENMNNPEEIIVKLIGLGNSTREKQNDCVHLATIIESLVAENIVASHWLFSVTGSLHKHGVRNLHNSILFLKGQQGMAYLSQAGRQVADRRLDQHIDDQLMNRNANYTMASGWIGQVQGNAFFKQVLNNQNPRQSGAGFLWFCRGLSSHAQKHNRNNRYPVQQQWVDLYNMWPEFFNILHEILVIEAVYAYESEVPSDSILEIPVPHPDV